MKKLWLVLGLSLLSLVFVSCGGGGLPDQAKTALDEDLSGYLDSDLDWQMFEKFRNYTIISTQEAKASYRSGGVVAEETLCVVIESGDGSDTLHYILYRVEELWKADIVADGAMPSWRFEDVGCDNVDVR